MAIENEDNIEIGFSLVNFDELISKISYAKNLINDLGQAEKGVVNSDNAKFAKKAEDVLKYAGSIEDLVSKISDLQIKLKQGVQLQQFDESQITSMVRTLENAQTKLLSFTTSFDQKLNAILGGTNFSTFTGNVAEVSLSKVRTLLSDVSRGITDSASAVKDLSDASKNLSNVKMPEANTENLSRALSLIKEINKESERKSKKSIAQVDAQYGSNTKAFPKEEKITIQDAQKNVINTREKLEIELKELERERARLNRSQRKYASSGGLSETEADLLQRVRSRIKELRVEIKATPVISVITDASKLKNTKEVVFTVDDATAKPPKSNLFPDNPDLDEPYRQDLNPTKKKDAKLKRRNLKKSSDRVAKTEFYASLIDKGADTSESKLVQKLAFEFKALTDEYAKTELADQDFIKAHREIRQGLVEKVTDKTFDLTALTVEQRQFIEQIRRRQKKLQGDKTPGLVGPIRFDTQEDIKFEKERAKLEEERKQRNLDNQRLAENLKKNKQDRDSLNELEVQESNLRDAERLNEQNYMRKRTTVPDPKVMAENDAAKARVEAFFAEQRKKVILGKIAPEHRQHSYWDKTKGSSDLFYFPETSRGQVDLYPGALNRAPTTSAAFNPDEVENKLAFEQRDFVKAVVNNAVNEAVNELKKRRKFPRQYKPTGGLGFVMPNVPNMTGVNFGDRDYEGSEYDVYKKGTNVVKVAKPYVDDNAYEEKVRKALEVSQVLGDKSLQLIGKFQDQEGKSQPVFTQKFIEGREATENEIAEEMAKRGFKETLSKEGYKNYKGKVGGKNYLVEDLQPSNVLVDAAGNVHIVDASLTEKATKRGQRKIYDPEAYKPLQVRQEDLYQPSQQDKQKRIDELEEKRIKDAFNQSMLDDELKRQKTSSFGRPVGSGSSGGSGGNNNNPPPNEPPDDDDPNKKRRPKGRSFEEEYESLKSNVNTGGFTPEDVDFNNKFNSSLLGLQKQIRSTIKSMIDLSEKGEIPGFKDGDKIAEQYARELYGLLGVAKDLDLQFAKQGRSSPSEVQLTEAKLLKKEYLDILRLVNALNDVKTLSRLSPSGPDDDDPNLPLNAKDRALKNAASLKAAANKTRADLETQRQFELDKAGRTGDKSLENRVSLLQGKAGELIKNVQTLEKLIETTDDKNMITDLTKYSDRLRLSLIAIQSELEDIKDRTSSLDKIDVNKNKKIDKSISDVNQLSRTSASTIGQFRTLLDRRDSRKLGIAEEARQGIREVRDIQEEIIEIQKLLRQPLRKTVFDSLIEQSRALEKRLEENKNTLARLQGVARAVPAPKAVTPGYQQAAQGFGLPFASRLPLAFAIGFTIAEVQQFIQLADQVFERVSQITSANRQLAASALEIGYSYDYLNEKNTNFSNLLAIGRTEGTELTAKVAQLAGRTQRPENIDVLMKGFADLAAARGLQPEELKATIQQIISGQDEGYKKLGLRSPGQVYEEYAQKRGRTVADLTPVEKSQIFEQAFLQKSELFSGAAEARLSSLDGRVGKLRANWTDMMDNFKLSIAGNYEVGRGIDYLTGAFANLNKEVENLSKLQEMGSLDKLDTKIKELAAPGVLAAIGSFFQLFAISGAQLGKAFTLLDPKKTQMLEKDAQRNADSIAATYNEDIREDTIRQQINAETLQRALQRKGARDRLVEIEREKVEEDMIRRRETESKRFKDNSRRSIYYQDIDTIKQGIAQARAYRLPGKEKLNEYELLQEIRKRVSAEIQAPQDKKLFPEFAQFDGPVENSQLYKSISEQTRKEFESRINASNKPLFTDEQAQQIIESQVADLMQIYQKILSDPRIKPDKLFQTIGKIKSDTELLPEMKDQLLKEAEQIRQGFAMKLKGSIESLEQTLIGSFGTRTSNPFLDQLKGISKAGQDAYDSLLPLGKEIANQGKEAAEASGKYKLLLSAYQNTDRALLYRQEARRLQETPESQTGDFRRRMQNLEENLRYVDEARPLESRRYRARFMSSFYNPYGKYDSLDPFAESGEAGLRFGQSGIANMTGNFSPSGRRPGESLEDYQQRIKEERRKYIETKIKIKDFEEDEPLYNQADRSNLGVYGRAAIAKSILNRLPTDEELIPLMAGLNFYGGDRDKATKLLKLRESAIEDLQAENRQKNIDFVENQKFIDLNKRDVEERIRNLQTNGTGLNAMDKVQQALSIMNELGDENLSPQMRQNKIRLLGEAASLTELQRQEASKQMESITKFIESLKGKVSSKGLAVDLGDQVIMNLNVGSKQIEAEVKDRPSSWNVNENYGNGYTG